MSDIWERLSDHDRLELMGFDSKVGHEGFDYALEHYSPEFRDLGAGLTIEEVFTATAVEREVWWLQDDAVDQLNAHFSRSRT